MSNATPIINDPPNTLDIPDGVLEKIEKQWIERVKEMRRQCMRQVSFTGKRYQSDEREFFVGAMVALTSLDPAYKMPVRWTLMLLSGRIIVEEERFQ